MKQKLRLGDCYALSATNHIRNNCKGKPEDSPIRCKEYQVVIQVISSIYTVYKSWIGTGDILSIYWVRTGKWILKTYRSITERACVCTHAKAPARSGLGLALGLVVLLTMCLQAFAQSRGPVGPTLPGVTDSVFLMRGKVKASYTHKPLEGVRIALKGTDVATFTNEKGDFTLPLTKQDGILKATYHGFQTEEKVYENGVLPKGGTSLFMEWDYSMLQRVKIGDSIPDALWDMPLAVANHPDGRSLISLREYQSKPLIVMEFWAEYCKPCIETVDEWEGYLDGLEDGMQFFAVLMGKPENAALFAERRKWHSPNIVDEGGFRLNRSFFDRLVIGRLVWIKDGRLYAITDKTAYTPEQIKLLAEGVDVPLRSSIDWTYSTKN